ncbi:MAG: hypothetical protein MUP64_07610 [Anaerolineae bacterium]|nr:hypothetical protein [Anaerolineae bacterium]
MARDDLVVSRSGLVAGILVLFLVAAFLLGMVSTPFAEGKPLLLTRENLSLKEYLRVVELWLTEMETDRTTAARLLGEGGEGGHAVSLYAQSETARTVAVRLEKLRQEVERTRIPTSMLAFHGLVLEALEDHLVMAQVALGYTGAPTQENRASLEEWVGTCEDSLGALREALDEI